MRVSPKAARADHRPLKKADREARDRRLIAAVKHGVLMRDLQSRFGLSDNSIYDICRKHGVVPPRGGRKW
jgi:hypothetical protein